MKSDRHFIVNAFNKWKIVNGMEGSNFFVILRIDNFKKYLKEELSYCFLFFFFFDSRDFYLPDYIIRNESPVFGHNILVR